MKASPLRRAASRTLEALGPVPPGSVIVSALSGGADSVALLDVLDDLARERGLRLVAAHLDHGLRPEAADDAAFCATLCRERGIALVTERVDVRARAQRAQRGIEEVARLTRYSFLRRIQRRHGALAVAVGHTRDDQVETVLMRLLRGAGARGLAAMRARRGTIVRPLLTVSRREILAHLTERGLAWREDPSNDDRAFLRNRVRHELIPFLEARFNPRVRETLARTAGLLADEHEALTPGVEALLARACRLDGDETAISLAALRDAPRALARRTLRRALEHAGGLRGVAAVHVERLLGLARATQPSGKRLALPGQREAVVRYGEVVIRPRREACPFGDIPLSVPGRVTAPGGWTFSATSCGGQGPSAPAGTHVDLDLAGGLVVRTRRPGDRLRVRDREVSLKRFLGKRHVPFDVRGSLPLVATGRTVVWVPGLPLDAEGCGPQRVHLSVTRTPCAGRPEGAPREKA